MYPWPNGHPKLGQNCWPAGGQFTWPVTLVSYSVHSCGCGERGSSFSSTSNRPGSSPRVRGTHGLGILVLRIFRFIPAGAGNAQRRSKSPSPRPVHPRGCGERFAAQISSSMRCGSSPRVRGTPDGTDQISEIGRFIPAGAGNAPGPKITLVNTSVHPRGCGERCCLES